MYVSVSVCVCPCFGIRSSVCYMLCVCYVCVTCGICHVLYPDDGVNSSLQDTAISKQTTSTTSVMSTRTPAVAEVDISVVTATLSTDQYTADTVDMKSSQHTATQTSLVASSSMQVDQRPSSTANTVSVVHRTGDLTLGKSVKQIFATQHSRCQVATGDLIGVKRAPLTLKWDL